MSALRTLAAAHPVVPGAARTLGLELYRTGKLVDGKFEQSQEMLMKALSLDTSSTGPFLLMGKVLLRRSDPQSAVMYLGHAAKMDPRSVTAHTLLGQAYRSLGN